METLASRLDDYLPTADESGRERTRDLANQVQQLIDDDESLPEEMRIHLRQMAEQLTWCLDNYAISGDFELKNAIDRLLITVGQSTQQSTHRDWWTKIVNEFVYPFAVATLAQLTGGAILSIIGGDSGAGQGALSPGNGSH
ncbi:MAG: hypothetical protein J2P17_26015 [Mycobacterium sp.]|nr:hypothetical protein [Mycobacterium sp.]